MNSESMVLFSSWNRRKRRKQRFRSRLRREGRDGRRPSQNLPSTAICCHLVAAKPLRPFQPYYSLPLEGMLASLPLVISHWLWVIGCRSSFFTEARGGWGGRPQIAPSGVAYF
jgi:hypothetical protein